MAWNINETQLQLQLTDARLARSDRVHCLAVRHVHMLRRTLISAVLALAATSVAISPAFAQRDHGRDQRASDAPRTERFQRGGFPSSQWDQPGRDREDVPLGSVLRELQARYGGQHLDAQKVGDRYIISWITKDGRRLTIEVDASTGRILSTR